MAEVVIVAPIAHGKSEVVSAIGMLRSMVWI